MKSTSRFSWLIAPLTYEAFFEKHWGSEYLHIIRDSADYYADVLGMEEIERYFGSETLHPSFLRVLKSGRDLATSDWTRVEKRLNTGPYEVVDNEKLISLMSSGHAVVVNAAERTIPRLGSLCRDLEQELGVQIQANLYFTPPHEKGFSIHSDAHDILILQTYGKKTWRLFGTDASDSDLKCGEQCDQSRNARIEFEMSAGDLLYLPGGELHTVITTDQPSVHITVGLQTRKWFHLVQQLGVSAEQSVEFQKRLPDKFSSPGERELFFADFSKALSDLFSSADPLDLVSRDSNSQFKRGVADYGKLFSDVLKVEQLSIESVVSLREGVDARLVRNGGQAIVQFGTREIKFASILGQAVESSLRCEPFAVSEIKGLVSDSGKIEIASTLVKAGILTIHSLTH